MLRACFVLVGLLASLPALAGEMTVAEARHFIVGKMFHYTCFEGTRGQGRVYPDGSVAGSIQVRGSGQMRYAVLPPGTIQRERRSGLRLGARRADPPLLQPRASR